MYFFFVCKSKHDRKANEANEAREIRIQDKKPAERVVEQDLDDAEKAVVKALHEWLQSNPNVQWEISGRKNIEHCSDITAQRNITEPLSTRVWPLRCEKFSAANL